MAPNYFIWNPDPVFCYIRSIPIKWYSIFILLAFLGGRQIAKYIYGETKRPIEDVESLSIWVLCSALIGARLGEVLFYDFQYYVNHPLEALLPFRFTPQWTLLGYHGLSYHGALIGGAVGTYIYANYDIALQLFPPRFRFKKQPRKGQNFLWLTTPVALGIMMGFLVRFGNFVNSEIVGTPTSAPFSVLFAHDIVEQLHQSADSIEKVRIFSQDSPQEPTSLHRPITLEVVFKDTLLDEATVRSTLENNIKQCLVNNPYVKEHLYERPGVPLKYSLHRTPQRAYLAHIDTYGIPRHPVQLYESMVYLTALILLLYAWSGLHKQLSDGIIAAIAMIVCYGFRFIFEFFKEPFNVIFDGAVTLTMGHLLSLLTVLLGIAFLIYARNVSQKAST